MNQGGQNLRELKASMFLDKIGGASELFSGDSGEVRDILEYLKDELLKENNNLRIKLELALEEIGQFKSVDVDSIAKDDKIAELEEKLKSLEKSKGNNQYEVEFARMSAENANLKASQVYYFNAMREILKVAKKKNHQLKNALSLMSESDVAEIIAIMKEFKLNY